MTLHYGIDGIYIVPEIVRHTADSGKFAVLFDCQCALRFVTLASPGYANLSLVVPRALHFLYAKYLQREVTRTRAGHSSAFYDTCNVRALTVFHNAQRRPHRNLCTDRGPGLFSSDSMSCDTSDVLPKMDERHPSLYFDDGDVVLSAPISTHMDGGRIDVQYFRIHKFTMRHHSAIFRDMFALPTPASQQSYDGIPLIAMTDSAEDLAVLLKLLYYPL